MKKLIVAIALAIASLITPLQLSSAKALNNCSVYTVESYYTATTQNNVYNLQNAYNCHVHGYMRYSNPYTRCTQSYSGWYVYTSGAYGYAYYCKYAGE